ncbi:tripartite tricarboxylate transporter TctB family protein [Paracoccus aerodenitrificans]|uniref:tripartite tricarboxylate transporter TctB family protein n=1 Tax=Paracoccus aerodenitrificans TaxID=3017781 RepID=UPI0022EFE06D|nr:tripartite tricarboxylate transporter TctB family protein [Paracoccus aerodenitrificans]WBU63622.1 tripartite tricarboxylate transporter TctB family protein [Paracoccus aerodenitrificans]
MSTRDDISVVSSRVVAAELAAALGMAAVFALLSWVGSGFRGAAAYMPIAVSGLGCVAALAWAAGLLRKLPKVAAEEDVTLSKASLRRLATLAVLMVAFVVTIPHLGFFTAILVFLTAAPALMGLRPAWQAALSAAGLSVLLWLIFIVLLESPMPVDLIFGS